MLCIFETLRFMKVHSRPGCKVPLRLRFQAAASRHTHDVGCLRNQVLHSLEVTSGSCAQVVLREGDVRRRLRLQRPLMERPRKHWPNPSEQQQTLRAAVAAV